jgi:hypothetical protein
MPEPVNINAKNAPNPDQPAVGNAQKVSVPPRPPRSMQCEEEEDAVEKKKTVSTLASRALF